MSEPYSEPTIYVCGACRLMRLHSERTLPCPGCATMKRVRDLQAINADLCAALEALVDVVDPTTDPRDAEEPLRTAKAALAKARGEGTPQ